MISSSWGGSGAAILAAALLAAVVAHGDGGEALEPDAPEARPAPRVLESRWRRPEGCEPLGPAVTRREDGAWVYDARAESPSCRVTGDDDAQVRAWLDEIWIGAGARPRKGRGSD